MTEDRMSRARSGPGYSGNRLVSAVEDYLYSHSGDKFSLAETADVLHVNGSYLLRVYKACTGHTLLWYHSRVRCEKAKAMLAGNDLNISEIGEAVGFVSSAHFSHVFKKMTGMTPSAYRLKQRTEAGNAGAD